MECKSTKACLNNELGNYQANLSEVQVPLPQNNGSQDVNNGSLDNT